MKIEVGKMYEVVETKGAYKKGDTIEVVGIDNSFVNFTVEDEGDTIQHDFIAVINKLNLELKGTRKPAHYDTGIDTIAFMRANCPPEQVEGFLRGNAIKYLQRYDRKSQAVSDLKKSRHYIDMLIEELEGRE